MNLKRLFNFQSGHLLVALISASISLPLGIGIGTWIMGNQKPIIAAQPIPAVNTPIAVAPKQPDTSILLPDNNKIEIVGPIKKDLYLDFVDDYGNRVLIRIIPSSREKNFWVWLTNQ